MKSAFHFALLAGAALIAPATWAATITGVFPTTLADGVIIGVSGTAFPTNTADIALALRSNDRLIPVQVLSASPNLIQARVGPLPAGVSNATIYAALGAGNRQGLVEPMLFGSPYIWDSRAAASGFMVANGSLATNQPLFLIPTPIPGAPALTNFLFTGAPAGGTLTMTLGTNVPIGARLLIQGHVAGNIGANRTNVAWTMPEVILPLGGTPSNVLVTLANVLTNGGAQIDLSLRARVTNFPAPASLVISTPGFDIHTGGVSVAISPLEAGRPTPAITSITPTNPGYEGIIAISGTNFGNRSLDLRAYIEGPSRFVPLAVLSVSDTLILGRVGFGPGQAFTGTLRVDRGVGFQTGAATNQTQNTLWISGYNLRASSSLQVAVPPAPTKQTGTVSFSSGQLVVNMPDPALITSPVQMSFYLYPRYTNTVTGVCPLLSQNPAVSTYPTRTPSVALAQDPIYQSIRSSLMSIGLCPSAANPAGGRLNVTASQCTSGTCILTGAVGTVVFCPWSETGVVGDGSECFCPVQKHDNSSSPIVAARSALRMGDPAPVGRILRARVVEGTFLPSYDDVVVSGQGPFYDRTNRSFLAAPPVTLVPVTNPPGAITVVGTNQGGVVVLRITNSLPANTQVRLTAHFEVNGGPVIVRGAAYPLFVFNQALNANGIAHRLRDALEDGFARNLSADLTATILTSGITNELRVAFPGRNITNGCVRVTFTPCTTNALRIQRTGVGNLLVLDWCDPFQRLQRAAGLEGVPVWARLNVPQPYLFAPSNHAAFFRLIKP